MPALLSFLGMVIPYTLFMLIIVIVCIILSMMWNSLSTFLTSVGKELIYNAF